MRAHAHALHTRSRFFLVFLVHSLEIAFDVRCENGVKVLLCVENEAFVIDFTVQVNGQLWNAQNRTAKQKVAQISNERRREGVVVW